MCAEIKSSMCSFQHTIELWFNVQLLQEWRDTVFVMKELWMTRIKCNPRRVWHDYMHIYKRDTWKFGLVTCYWPFSICHHTWYEPPCHHHLITSATMLDLGPKTWRTSNEAQTMTHNDRLLPATCPGLPTQAPRVTPTVAGCDAFSASLMFLIACAA